MPIIWCMVLEIWSKTDRIFYHSGLFFALLHPYGPRKSKFWKNDKTNWRYYHFTRVPYMTIIWCIVPEIRSMTNIIFCHFGPFFALLPTSQTKISKFWKKWKNIWRYHFTHVHHKWQSNNVWFLRHWACQTELFVILDHFLPFYPLNNLKN